MRLLLLQKEVFFMGRQLRGNLSHSYLGPWVVPLQLLDHALVKFFEGRFEVGWGHEEIELKKGEKLMQKRFESPRSYIQKRDKIIISLKPIIMEF